MGQSTSKEEELFVRGDFAEVVSSPTPSYVAAPQAESRFLVLSSVEWEALCALCENGDKNDALRTIAAKIESATESSIPLLANPSGESAVFAADAVCSFCPLICCFVHLVAAEFGVVTREKAKTTWDKVIAGLNGQDMSDARQTPSARSRWAATQLKLVEDFVVAASAVDAVPRVERGTTLNNAAAISRVAQRASSTLSSTYYNSKSPVLRLIFAFTGATLARAASLRISMQEDGVSDLAQQWMLTSIDLLRQTAQVMHPAVSVAFLERAMNTMRDVIFDAELAQLARSYTPPTGMFSPSSDRTLVTWETLSETFVGQSDCVEYLRAHFKARSRDLTPSNKPSVFVFFGPSGHGKTELGRLIAMIEHREKLAKAGATSPEATGHLCVLHMTSYCTRDSVYSLVDPPAAHVGDGILISAVRKVPDVTVVLDEFEKSSADAVQHVWLSAFPRHGKLHSLKDASRSVSTEKATFILTCNTLADDIDAARESYLAASPGMKQQMREEWVEKCKAELRVRFGEPLVARIDAFMPFVPYSAAETRKFVELQLLSKRRDQNRVQRDVLWTDSFLAFVTAQSTAKGFHAPKAERILQPHLLKLSDRVAARHSCDTDVDYNNGMAERVLLLHASPALRGPSIDVSYVGCTELFALGLPGATVLARRIGSQETASSRRQTNMGSSAPASARPVPIAKPLESRPTYAAENLNPSGAVSGDPTSGGKELLLETVTERERMLVTEISTQKAQILELQAEVQSLKETVKHLETALGLALAVIMSLMFVLSLFISLWTLASLAALLIAGLQFAVGNARLILTTALRGLIGLLGHGRAVAVVVLLVAWIMFQVSRGVYPISCPSPPVCPGTPTSAASGRFLFF